MAVLGLATLPRDVPLGIDSTTAGEVVPGLRRNRLCVTSLELAIALAKRLLLSALPPMTLYPMAELGVNCVAAPVLTARAPPLQCMFPVPLGTIGVLPLLMARAMIEEVGVDRPMAILMLSALGMQQHRLFPRVTWWSGPLRLLDSVVMLLLVSRVDVGTIGSRSAREL